MSKLYKAIVILSGSTLLSSCLVGTGEEDTLRDPISSTGISLGLQVNLPLGASEAQAAATIYKDGVRQPLVGGDFFMATSSVDDAVLKSLENLSGDYIGRVSVAGAADPVYLSTEYDPERAREDRWYPVDELLIDPGPNEDLVGYVAEVNFPLPLQNLTINATTFDSRTDPVILNWTAGNGDQMTTSAVVTCNGADGTHYTYPIFVGLGTDDGTATFNVGQIIPDTTILSAVIGLYQELVTLITAAVLDYYTYGLISVKNVPLSTYNIQSCDVQLTVFREIGYDLPATVEGGYVIGSSSDTVSFTYIP